MVDTYTKIVLTLIGVALCALVIQNAVPSAAALGKSDCGNKSYRACHFKLKIEHSGSVDLDMDMDQVLMEIGGEIGLAHGTAVVLMKDVD
jgi:hypothetical protein